MFDFLYDLITLAIPKRAQFGCMMAGAIALLTAIIVLIWVSAK